MISDIVGGEGCYGSPERYARMDLVHDLVARCGVEATDGMVDVALRKSNEDVTLAAEFIIRCQ